MGPTEAGFVFGNALLGAPFQVHLISVEYQADELLDRIAQIHEDIARLIGRDDVGFNRDAVTVHMEYLGNGYNQPTEACEQAILHFARVEGILLEHTYTGKTFAGLLDLVRSGLFNDDEPACVIHTGGTAALFSQMEMFKTL